MQEPMKVNSSEPAGAKGRPAGKLYSLGEEIFNSVTHGVGALLGVVALVIMLVFAAKSRDPWKVVSSALFGASLILLYTMSTLYHAISAPRGKKVLQVFDHCTIYLLIAGTYSPYCLVSLRESVGWYIFAGVWGCAILGIVLTAIDLHKFKTLAMVLYLGMGWCVLAAIRPLLQALETGGVVLLVLGGLSYTLGIIFYALKNTKYMHSIWHLFVLGGSLLHFFSVLFYVIL